jgi:hypothetical protein
LRKFKKFNLQNPKRTFELATEIESENGMIRELEKLVKIHGKFPYQISVQPETF